MMNYTAATELKGTVFTKYKQSVDNCFDICSRHALHAKTLALSIHSRKEIEFNSEIPKDMQTKLLTPRV